MQPAQISSGARHEERMSNVEMVSVCQVGKVYCVLSSDQVCKIVGDWTGRRGILRAVM